MKCPQIVCISGRHSEMRYRKGVPSLLNEVEGEQLTKRRNRKQMIKDFEQEYPETAVVLTLGGAGAVYAAGGEVFSLSGKKIEALDTTGAGDRLPAIFLWALTDGKTPRRCLEEAAAAAAIAVSRFGLRLPFLRSEGKAVERQSGPVKSGFLQRRYILLLHIIYRQRKIGFLRCLHILPSFCILTDKKTCEE